MADSNDAPAQLHSSSRDPEWTLARRLRSRKFVGEDAVAAIHGRKLPFHLGRPLVRHCVVRGIRHHLEFATGEAAALYGALPAFTTAINARLIMSNRIPDMKGTEEMPYCIWYPDLPSEETLRQLVALYPDVRYQVGRTCAVAGYTALYKSLDILPEVTIAEEARESGNLDIFECIINALVKWKVFDDYTGTLCSPTPSRLNGDTVVCKRLRYRQGFQKPSGRVQGEEGDSDSDDESDDDMFSSSSLFDDPYGYQPLPYNVTGDMSLDAPDSWADMARFRRSLPVSSSPLSQTVLNLLSNPLPADLPTCDKDVLIVMAAYRGDLDRYCRLRRPFLVHGELEAIIRGIYHNSQFAKWWSTQPPPDAQGVSRIATAIIARFIMNDDISWALKLRDGKLDLWNASYPSLIFYPDIANSDTYEALARAIPAMRPAVARAAIYANYKALFDLLVQTNADFEPVTLDHALYAESVQSPEPYYLETIERNAHDKGILDTVKKLSPRLKPWQQVSLRRSDIHVQSNSLHAKPDSWRAIASDCQDWPQAIYDGVLCNAIGLERYLSLPEEWRPTSKDVDKDAGEVLLDYKSWPPRFTELLQPEPETVNL